MADGPSQVIHPGRQAAVHTGGESPKDSPISEQEMYKNKTKNTSKPKSLCVLSSIFSSSSLPHPPHPAHFHIPRIPQTALPPPPHHTHFHIPRIPTHAASTECRTPAGAPEARGPWLWEATGGHQDRRQGQECSPGISVLYRLMRKPKKSNLDTLHFAKYSR